VLVRLDRIARAAKGCWLHQLVRRRQVPRGHGVVATLRREKGHDIVAACGQLRLQTKRAEGEVRRMTA